MKKMQIVILLITNTFFFDIALKAQNNNAFPLTVSIWETKKISICWDNPSENNKTERSWVEDAIKRSWQKYSSLQFTDWCNATEKNGDIHIYIDEDTPHTKRLGKFLKNMPKGMVLNFSFKNWSQPCMGKREFCIKAIAIHEFGHALGFAHEQNRTDCHFDDCMKEPSGENGDWFMSPCDLKSIMNYCNPDWNNNGELSETDIAVLQRFYSKPNNYAPLFPTIELAHTSQITNKKNIGTKKINHLIKVYVTGDDEKMKKINKVVYYLHNTFKNNIITITDPSTNFGLGLRVWGEFELKADVIMKDGKVENLNRYLNFQDSESKIKPVKKSG